MRVLIFFLCVVSVTHCHLLALPTLRIECPTISQEGIRKNLQFISGVNSSNPRTLEFTGHVAVFPTIVGEICGNEFTTKVYVDNPTHQTLGRIDHYMYELRNRGYRGVIYTESPRRRWACDGDAPRECYEMAEFYNLLVHQPSLGTLVIEMPATSALSARNLLKTMDTFSNRLRIK